MTDLRGCYRAAVDSGDIEADEIHRSVRSDPQVPGNYLISYVDPESNAVLHRGFPMGQREVQYLIDQGFWKRVDGER